MYNVAVICYIVFGVFMFLVNMFSIATEFRFNVSRAEHYCNNSIFID